MTTRSQVLLLNSGFIWKLVSMHWLLDIGFVKLYHNITVECYVLQQVTARWLLDLEEFNEWMNEEDYLVDDEVSMLRYVTLRIMTPSWMRGSARWAGR